MQTNLKTANRKKTLARSFFLDSIARRVVPSAISLVLAAQCISLNLPQSAVWAAEDMPEAAAPSWNDFKSDSAKIIEGSADTSAPSKSANQAETGTTADSDVRPSGDGRAIAEATRVAPAEAASTTSDAAVLSPAQITPSTGQPDSVTAVDTADLKAIDSDAAKAADTRVGDTGADIIKTAATNPAAASDAALISPAKDSFIAPGTIFGQAAGKSTEAPLAPPPQVGSSAATASTDSLPGQLLKGLGATVTSTETTPMEADGTVMEGGVMVVDCDNKPLVEEEMKYENLETDEAKTYIKTGAVFPVVISSQISSKTSKKGDPVEARLKYDLKIGDRLIARKGAEVHGHINYSLKARPAMRALISSERWYRNAGCIGLEFDEVINDKGEHLPLVAAPAKASRIVVNKNEGRILGVNKDGQIACPSSLQWRDRAVRIGIHAALAPAGVFSFGAVPLAMGLYGAANPSFAFMKPVGNSVRHRRLKGFAWGFISGVPGGMIIEDSIVKGQESVIKPGDVFLAEFRQEFNGQPSTEAQLMPNATTKVHGEVYEDKGDQPTAEKTK